MLSIRRTWPAARDFDLRGARLLRVGVVGFLGSSRLYRTSTAVPAKCAFQVSASMTSGGRPTEQRSSFVQT